MSHFSQSLLTDFARPRRLALLAVLAVAAFPSTADARIGRYDGVWNVTFATTRGNCSSGYSVPFTVAGGRVLSAGGGRVSGKVNRGGSVAVHVSVGASHASGGGSDARVAATLASELHPFVGSGRHFESRSIERSPRPPPPYEPRATSWPVGPIAVAVSVWLIGRAPVPATGIEKQQVDLLHRNWEM